MFDTTWSSSVSPAPGARHRGRLDPLDALALTSLGLKGYSRERAAELHTLPHCGHSSQTPLEPKYTGKFPDSFPKDVIPNIEKVYRVISGQTE